MNKELADLIELRPYKKEDHSFILATMLRGLYYGDSWFSLIPKAIFMDNYKHVIEAIISSPNNTVVVAVLKEDKDVILGYSIVGQSLDRLHFVFVKKDWRLKGVGRLLVPKHLLVVTHLTNLGKSLLSKFKDVVFNPFDLN